MKGREDMDTLQPAVAEDEDSSLDSLLDGPLGSDPQDGCMFLRPVLLDVFARELLAAIREAETVTEN